jgi:hypothetical protein
MAPQTHRWIQLAVSASALAALACSAHAQTCSVITLQPGGGEVSIAGATLFVDFVISPSSTHDWIDADGDGCSTEFCKGFPGQPADQLGTPWSPGFGGSSFFEVQYRSVGSVNGYREFIASQLCGLFNKSVPSEQGLLNGFLWATGGVKNPLTAPGCDYLLADTDGDGWAFPGQDGDALTDPGSPTSINGIDIALLDVPGVWATRVTNPASALWNADPGDVGYGDNPIPASNVPTYFSKLPTLCRNCPDAGESLIEDCNPATDPGCECLNTNTSSPDGNTIYDNGITWAPIVYIANRGIGQSNYAITDLSHLMLTGRLRNGENLAASTRSVGSGTRNGMMNTTGIDPSWGMGDNLDAEWGTTSAAYLGPARRITNAAGSSQIEEAVKYSRLAIGYTGLAGASRAAEDAANGLYEILDVTFDDQGGVKPVRPTIESALVNCDVDAGFRLGGPVTMVTRGSITQDDAKAPDYMANQSARQYVANIFESIDVYDGSVPPGPAFWSPADYLVTNFTLVQGQNCVASFAEPTTFSTNPDFNPAIQAVSLAVTTTVTPAYGSVNVAGRVPRRTTSGQPYADETQLGLNLAVGAAVQYGYKLSSGAVAQFGLTLSGATLSDKRLSERNQVQGDFDNDGARDGGDIAAMMKAAMNPIDFEQDIVPAGGWGGTLGDMPEDVVIVHVIGDFDGNGQFDAADVRYFADGLALVPASLAGGTEQVLDRQAGFTSVDTAWAALPGGDNNYFNTVIHDAAGVPTGRYSAGDSRADIAGNTPWPGTQPKGHDGVVDCDDVLYVAANLGSFQNPAEAAITDAGVRLDLSADMDGNLVINCADVAAILEIMGESDLSACGLIADCATDPADLNHDGAVNGLDLALLLGVWTGAATYSPCPPHAPADLTADCRINGLDLATLLAAWNP